MQGYYKLIVGFREGFPKMSNTKQYLFQCFNNAVKHFEYVQAINRIIYDIVQSA